MRRCLLILLLPLALALGGCAGNPLATAQTVEQKAAALYGQFVIAEEAARGIVCPNYAERRSDPAVSCRSHAPEGVVRAVASVDAIAKPLADTLATAARRYADARTAVDAIRKSGAEPSPQLLAAVTTTLQSLSAAYEEAGPSIRALIAAIKSHANKE